MPLARGARGKQDLAGLRPFGTMLPRPGTGLKTAFTVSARRR